MFLNRPVNNEWISSIQNISHSALMGKGPENFSFSEEKASIGAREDEVQSIIDYFKGWLPDANRQYKARIVSEKRKAEEEQRLRLQHEIEEQEERQRVLNRIRL